MAKNSAGKKAAARARDQRPAPRRRGAVRLCYGEPIQEAGRTIIPVARVRRGGGMVDAVPRGYIEISAEGSRFVAIDDPDAIQRRLKSAATAAVALLGAVAGLRAARAVRGGSSRRLLGSGR